MPHLLVLADLYPPEFAPRVASSVQHFIDEGYRVTVISERITKSSKDSHGNVFDQLDDQCSTHRLDLDQRHSWLRMISNTLFDHKSQKVIRLATQLHDKDPFDAIMAFTYRTFPLPAAAQLGKRLNIPVVMDCRDIIEQYNTQGFLPYDKQRIVKRVPFLANILKRLFIAQRNRALKHATAITTVSDWHQKTLSQHFPQTPVHTVLNGYDESLFIPQSTSNDGPFNIVYTGRILNLQMRNPKLLFDALSQDQWQKLIDQQQVTIEWYCDKASVEMIQTLLAHYPANLQSINHFHAMVPFAEVPNILNNASMLLLLGQKEDLKSAHGMVTTKLFESLAMGKPILMIENDHSVCEAILRSFDGTLAADHVEEVNKFLQQEYQKNQQNPQKAKQTYNRQGVENYSRKRMAWQFINIFRTLVI